MCNNIIHCVCKLGSEVDCISLSCLVHLVDKLQQFVMEPHLELRKHLLQYIHRYLRVDHVCGVKQVPLKAAISMLFGIISFVSDEADVVPSPIL